MCSWSRQCANMAQIRVQGGRRKRELSLEDQVEAGSGVLPAHQHSNRR